MRITVSFGPDHLTNYVSNLNDLGAVIGQTAEIIGDVLGAEAFVHVGGCRRARLFTVAENSRVNVTVNTSDGAHAISGYWAPTA